MVHMHFNRIQKIQNAQGLLIGLAAGDALGANCEGFTHDEISDELIKLRQINEQSGVWTDDTAMALCLADSLLECGGYDSYDVMSKYIEWADTGYRTYFNFGEGIGVQTAMVLREYKESDDPTIYSSLRKRTSNAGNGNIMRIAPAIIVSLGQSIQACMNLAMISSRETHYSYETDATAEIFAAMCWQVFREDDKSKIIDVANYSDNETYQRILADVLNSAKEIGGSMLRNLGGYTIDALKIAIWGFMNHDNFVDGMRAVIKLGGDTDTNAAIYGQIAGGYYGLEAIPAAWQQDLYLYDEILDIANQLYSKQPYRIIRTRFKEDDTPDNLQRFVAAQDKHHLNIEDELRAGRKKTHWMWFAFPQIAGLGSSAMSQKYAIQSLHDAREYYANPVLHENILEWCKILIDLPDSKPEDIFGSIDALKLQSCATLFLYATKDQVFSRILDKFYGGRQDMQTVALFDETSGL